MGVHTSLLWIRDVVWLGPPAPKVLGSDKYSKTTPQIQMLSSWYFDAKGSDAILAMLHDVTTFSFDTKGSDAILVTTLIQRGAMLY